MNYSVAVRRSLEAGCAGLVFLFTTGAGPAWTLRAEAYDAETYNVEVSWSAVPDAAGYRVYMRATDEPFGTGADVGMGQSGTDGVVRYVAAGVPADQTTLFAITSYDAAGNESAFSNELQLTVSTLAADIGAADDMLPVDTLDQLPNSGIVQIDRELIRYTAKQAGGTGSAAGDLVGLSRGIDGTVPDAHTAGTLVQLAESDCAGDCNADGVITITDLITSINIVLGADPLTICSNVDSNGDGTVTVDELITAINHALSGCTF